MKFEFGSSVTTTARQPNLNDSLTLTLEFEDLNGSWPFRKLPRTQDYYNTTLMLIWLLSGVKQTKEATEAARYLKARL